MRKVRKAIDEVKAQLMANVPLRIQGRDDLMTSVERVEYLVEDRLGRMYLPDGCTVDRDAALRLFLAIDPEMLRMEVYAGGKPDAFYERRANDWANTFLAE